MHFYFPGLGEIFENGRTKSEKHPLKIVYRVTYAFCYCVNVISYRECLVIRYFRFAFNDPYLAAVGFLVFPACLAVSRNADTINIVMRKRRNNAYPRLCLVFPELIGLSLVIVFSAKKIPRKKIRNCDYVFKRYAVEVMIKLLYMVCRNRHEISSVKHLAYI